MARATAPLSGARFGLALAASKASVAALTLAGRNASQGPGMVAEALDPNFLAHVGKPEQIVCVTGTNGKTTTTNLLIDLLHDSGLDVCENRAGGNIATGIASALLKDTTISGAPKHKLAVFELDELSSRVVLPHMTPKIIACTNLYRDSFMRNANPDYISSVLSASISPETELVLNADDLISCRIAPQCEKRIYYSVCKLPSDKAKPSAIVSDLTACPECGGTLEYEYSHIRHVGRARCTSCGLTNPPADFELISVDTQAGTFVVRENSEPGAPEQEYSIANYTTTNLYNLLTAIVVCRRLGLSRAQIAASLKRGINITTARYNEELMGDTRVVAVSAKGENGTGVSVGFDSIVSDEGTKEVVLAITDHFLSADPYASEYIGWHYLADFEILADPSVRKIVIIGEREQDLLLRLLLAGVPRERVVFAADGTEAANLMQAEGADGIYIAYDIYNGDIVKDFQKRLRERLGGAA